MPTQNSSTENTNTPPIEGKNRSSFRLLALLGILSGVVLVALAVNYFTPKPSPREVPPPLPAQKKSQPVPLKRPDLKGAISLSLPEGKSLSVGKEGLVEVRFNTYDTHITVVRAVLTFDPTQVAFLGQNAKDTSLPMEVNPPGALDTRGRIELVRFIPGPGAKGGEGGFAGSGLFTSLRVKPLKAGEVKFTIDAKESQFVPYMTAEKYQFSEIRDDVFMVK
ncbi:MAG: hypothetical protein AB1352_00980 [Patescibacteria group bacterium]